MVVDAVASACPASTIHYVLHPIKELRLDQLLMPTAVFLALVSDITKVVTVA
jgi:hypothetical protein